MVALLRLTLLTCTFLTIGCATPSNATDEKDVLLGVDRQWSAVASQGKDAVRIVSYWSDDATILSPGAAPVRGKAAIRAFVLRSLATPGFHISWRPSQASISRDGSLGYTMGENFLTFPGTGGKLIRASGRYVTIWRRTPGGAWKCVVDTWNSR
ncbi:MAG TPA: DUF4440 domain-containing protein [Candidatus Binatia bacterium]|nr:DUF4440 domain-containing protein [Candidatus Binatia bacterium]